MTGPMSFKFAGRYPALFPGEVRVKKETRSSNLDSGSLESENEIMACESVVLVGSEVKKGMWFTTRAGVPIGNVTVDIMTGKMLERFKIHHE